MTEHTKMVEREIEGSRVNATLHESKLSVEFWVADNHKLNPRESYLD